MNVVVSGVGLITAVGDNARQSCAAIRAGFANPSEVGYVCTPPDLTWGEPEHARAAMAPVAEQGPQRVEALARTALDDLLKGPGGARLSRSAFETATCVYVAPSAPSSPALARLHPNMRHEAHRDMLGAAIALRHAIAAGELERAVLLGVTTVGAERLASLDADGRLKSSRNDDGFIPGEAAAALVLEREDIARVPRCRLAAAAHIQSTEQPLARGLSDALHHVLDDQQSRWLLTDLNGETRACRAHGIARSRLGKQLIEPLAVWHPASSTGDVGATMGGVLLAAACAAFEHGYAPDDRGIAVSTTGGVSSALLFERADR